MFTSGNVFVLCTSDCFATAKENNLTYETFHRTRAPSIHVAEWHSVRDTVRVNYNHSQVQITLSSLLVLMDFLIWTHCIGLRRRILGKFKPLSRTHPPFLYIYQPHARRILTTLLNYVSFSLIISVVAGTLIFYLVYRRFQRMDFYEFCFEKKKNLLVVFFLLTNRHPLYEHFCNLCSLFLYPSTAYVSL